MNPKTERNQSVYVFISLWIEDNPDPPLDENGRLMREYVNDFVSSGFLIEEIKEAVRRYRRDYQYSKRNFGFLWDLCKQVRAERLDIAPALEAWPLLWKVDTIRRCDKGWFVPVPPNEVTIEMVLDVHPQPSHATAERLLRIIQTIGIKGLDTGNEAADRARFVQIYETIDDRITNLQVWNTPKNLLPEGTQSVAQLTQNIKTEKE